MGTHDIGASLSLIEAYSNPIRSSIMIYLKMFNRLSLGELAKHLGKSKPTIIRHIDKLIELDLVHKFIDEEEVQPGNIKRYYYELNKEVKHVVSGVKLMNLAKENPEKYTLPMLQLIDTAITRYKLLEQIAVSTTTYLEKMKVEFEQNVQHPEKFNEIAKDHVGRISFDYINKDVAFDLIKEGFQVFDTLQKEDEISDSENNPYLYIRALLPILRIMDMEHAKEWKLDGTLWP